MSQRVVDVLEMVEVQIKHGKARAVVSRPGDRFLDCRGKHGAVGQPVVRRSSRANSRSLAWLRLCTVIFPNCSRDQDALIALQGTQHDLNGKFAAVLALCRQLDPRAHLLGQRIGGTAGAVGDQPLREFPGRSARSSASARPVRRCRSRISLAGLVVRQDDLSTLVSPRPWHPAPPPAGRGSGPRPAPGAVRRPCVPRRRARALQAAAATINKPRTEPNMATLSASFSLRFEAALRSASSRNSSLCRSRTIA